jgi:hypothetical protein
MLLEGQKKLAREFSLIKGIAYKKIICIFVCLRNLKGTFTKEQIFTVFCVMSEIETGFKDDIFF